MKYRSMNRHDADSTNFELHSGDIDMGMSLARLCREGVFPVAEWAVLLDRLGRDERPKVYAAVATQGQKDAILGLYTQNQGRQPGRMNDFSAVYRVGGLIVDRAKAPERGVVEFVRDVDVPPDNAAWPWPAGQVIRTDGRRWRAMFEDGWGEWVTREAFDVTPPDGAPNDWPRDPDDIPAGTQAAFTEFLRRALLPLELTPSLSTMARRLASHARAQAGTWFDSGEGQYRVKGFRQALHTELGLELTTPSHTARMLATLEMLAAIHETILPHSTYILQDFHCDWNFRGSVSPTAMDDISRLREAWFAHRHSAESAQARDTL
jgi:hypothetical protein